MRDGIFPALLLLGRPAAGKSEIIDHLRRMSPAARRRKCHVGIFQEIDDFPLLWAWFEEDRILQEMGERWLHTDEAGYFASPMLWHLLIRRLELEYWKSDGESGGFGGRRTAIVEFSRGSEHGGYRQALRHLSPRFLTRSAVLYVDVSYEESLRKNRRRFNPDRPHSILEHSLPDEKLERLYRGCDWEEISGDDSRYLHICDAKVPYVVFPNNDDVTTRGGRPLDQRLAECLESLWHCRAALHAEAPDKPKGDLPAP